MKKTLNGIFMSGAALLGLSACSTVEKGYDTGDAYCTETINAGGEKGFAVINDNGEILWKTSAVTKKSDTYSWGAATKGYVAEFTGVSFDIDFTNGVLTSCRLTSKYDEVDRFYPKPSRAEFVP